MGNPIRRHQLSESTSSKTTPNLNSQTRSILLIEIPLWCSFNMNSGKGEPSLQQRHVAKLLRGLNSGKKK